MHPQLVSNEKYHLQIVSHFIILKQIMWDGTVTKNNNYKEKGIYEFKLIVLNLCCHIQLSIQDWLIRKYIFKSTFIMRLNDWSI